MKRIISFLVVIFLSFTSISSFSVSSIPGTTTPDNDTTHLIIEVDRYITKQFPRSRLNAESLVAVCLEYDFDICFALAQGTIESGLGTAGVARKTNSPWNVGAYDGRSARSMARKGLGYDHPDESIEPYVQLVKRKYLGKNKDIHDLMKNYITLSGHRYASSPTYESELRRTYNRIRKGTSIHDLQYQL